MQSATRKLDFLMRGENSHVSQLLEAYFNDYEMMGIDGLGYEGYQRYLKIYSYDDLNNFIDALKIQENEKRWQMALAIITAASRYEDWKSYLERKPKVKEYKASMKRLRNALRKAYKELDFDVGDEDVQVLYQIHFKNALAKKITGLCENELSIYNFSAPLKAVNFQGFISPADLGLFVEVMAEVAEEQEKNPPFETEEHEESIHRWMVNIAFPWEEYSGLPLMTGKNHKDVGYVSDQMKILEDIMKPLDSSVTNTQIGNALKIYLSRPEGGRVQLENFL